jgi:ElaB/YqjD/DUF883 family membrane-anchored ribosome-binding protein
MGNNPSHGTQNIENTLGRAANEVKDKAQNLADKARDTAGNLADKARDTAANLGDKARDAAANLGDKARDTATALKDKTDSTITTVGQKMTALADDIRTKGPHDGMLGNAASSVADNLGAGGRYLQQHGLDDMGRDVTNMVRQYPLQSLLVGFGIGCLMGMSLSRR